MLATLTKAARAIVPDRNKLEKELARLRALVEELSRREQFNAAASALLARRLQSYEETRVALGVALAGDSIENVRAALDKLDATPIHFELLRGYAAELNKAGSLRIPRDAFLQQHPEARSILKSACLLRLNEKRSDLQRVTREETSHLNSLGDYDAADSPVVRRASATVAHLERLVGEIESHPDFPSVFVNFATQLLE